MAAELEAASNIDHFHAQDSVKFASITSGLASIKTLLADQDSQAASELAKFMSMLADTKTTTGSRLDGSDAQYDAAWIGKADSMLSLIKVQDYFNSAHWIGGMTPKEACGFAIMLPILGNVQCELNIFNGVQHVAIDMLNFGHINDPRYD